MPIFEYSCTCCKKGFEEIVLDGKAPVCPACGADNPIKLISNFTIRSRSIAEPDYEKDVITQRGVDPTKEYEVIHDKPIDTVTTSTGDL